MGRDFIVIIPARLASSRLPEKPLLAIGDKPLLQHVYEQAGHSSTGRVVIATDSRKIQGLAQGFGAEAVMTSGRHRCGTERIAEACTLLGLEDEQVVVNVQGDEFMLPPALIDQAATDLQARPAAAIATLCEAIMDAAAKADPHVVKVVFDQAGMALYFSRAAIPHGQGRAWRHIGLYAYRAGFIRQFYRLPPSTLEEQEGLEQLRAMSHGHRIHVGVVSDNPAIGIDTEADLQRARQLYARQGAG